MQEKNCCVIGYLEIPADRLGDVRRELEREFGAALEDGYRKLFTSFTAGAGMLFARCVIEQRENYPDIFLEVVLNPNNCEGFTRDNEWELLSKSNGIRGLCEECRQDYPLSVTRYLVEQASRVIAVCDGEADHDTLYVGRLAPYGYTKSPDDCQKLIIDEETATVVRQIFGWAAEGVGGNEISRRLSAAGIPSPSHRNHAKGFNTSEKLLGNVYWKSRTVKDLLMDRVYIGDMVQGKTRTVSNKQINTDPGEWVCVPNTHEPLVSREVWLIGHMKTATAPRVTGATIP